MSKAFEIGKDYYTADGNKVELLAITNDDQYVVSKVMQIEVYDDVYYERGETIIVEKLFSAPPKEVVDTDIAALREEKEKLSQLNVDLRCKATVAERDVQERLKRLEKYDALELVGDFLEGRITHFLIEDYDDYKVVSLDGLKTDDKWRQEFRMVCLFGRATGDPEWRINQYSDGSGGDWRKLIPCRSEDDAKARHLELIAKDLDEARGLIGSQTEYTVCKHVRRAIKHKLPVSEDLMEIYRNKELESIASKRKRAKNYIAQYQKEIDEADAEEAALVKAKGEEG